MSQQNNKNNVIQDKEDSQGFIVDWDTIEKNYRERHRHRSHSHDDDNNSENINSSSGNHSKKSGSFKKKWSRGKKVLVGILLFLLCLILGAVCAFLFLQYKGKQTLLNYDNLNINVPDGIDYEDGGNIIYYNGHTYEFNKNIATILFMGIDNTELKDNATAGTAGQADALYLFTYDTSTGRIKILCLNRDTMTDISRYTESGEYYDTSTAQLCLAFAYGDGKTLSAENQVTAVERLIYNVPVNAYYAIDLSAIKILNDDIGGVTLTPEYTFGSFTKGQQITILGDLAEEFVRTRDTSLLDDNLRRMACQRQYLTAFSSQIIPAIKSDINVPVRLYRDSSEYTVTNIDVSALTYLASTLAFKYSGLEFITTSGEYKDVSGDEFAEFELDKDEFFETILDIFYIQID